MNLVASYSRESLGSEARTTDQEVSIRSSSATFLTTGDIISYGRLDMARSALSGLQPTTSKSNSLLKEKPKMGESCSLANSFLSFTRFVAWRITIARLSKTAAVNRELSLYQKAGQQPIVQRSHSQVGMFL